MKNLVMFLVFMMSFMTSFGQVYHIHVDTIQNFQHSANVTTLFAEKNNMVEYTGGGLTNVDFIVDFNKGTFTTIDQNKTIDVQKIYEVFDYSDKFEINIINNQNEITRVFVDKAVNEYNGLVICVRWNKMVNGDPITFGWFSKNIVMKKEVN